MTLIKIIGFFWILLQICPVQADPDWLAFTIDNDIFVGNDSGYSNGLYFTWINVDIGDHDIESQILLKPLLWTLGDNGKLATIVSNTVGQAINTPRDINIAVPPGDDLPYSGLLFFNSSYISIRENYADKIGVTLGIVGPSSGAEYIQKKFHSLTRSDDPQGWDTQLEDELVFQIKRGRAWRYWVSDNNEFDLLLDSEASFGTLASAVATGITFRYGEKLMRSYATHLFDSDRISSPVAVEGGWYYYVGLRARYVFNQIFADGNTFRDSRSIDYDRDTLGIHLGFSYSYDDFSLTFSLNDSTIIENKSETQLRDLTYFGALTVAWQYN